MDRGQTHPGPFPGQGHRFILLLNLKPFGLSAAFKKGEIVDD
jgi:hypothetical protein